VLGIEARGPLKTATRPAVNNRPDARAGGLVLLVSELAEPFADELLEGGDGMRDPCERALGFALAEAEAAEGLKRFRARVAHCRPDRAAVRRAVGMGEVQLRGSRADNDEPALVNGAMVRCAESHEVVEAVLAVFGPKHEVVRVRKDAVSAAGDARFPAVPTKDRAADCGRNGLSRADPRCARVDASGGATVYAHVCASVGAVVYAHECASVGVVVVYAHE